MVKKYKFQVDNLKQRISRLEKDNLRHKNDLKHMVDKNAWLKNELDYMTEFSKRDNKLIGERSIFGKTQIEKSNKTINASKFSESKRSANDATVSQSFDLSIDDSI